MCTLIVGRDVIGPETLVFGANRDENPLRPSDPPVVLHEHPRVLGGRDRVAGGTWLAIRPEGAAVAMLNRRPMRASAPAPTRSRGLLALDAASVSAANGQSLSEAVRRTVRDQHGRERFAPFSLLFLSREVSWILSWDGAATRRSSVEPEVLELAPGWHVVTHADLDDIREPRTARLHAELDGWLPESVAAALERLRRLLALHGLTASGEPAPAVCLHQGPMRTVSYALGAFTPDATRYLHGEGRPCEVEPASQEVLMGGETR